MAEEQNEDAIKILARVRELPELSYRARVLVGRALVLLGMPDPDKAPMPLWSDGMGACPHVSLWTQEQAGMAPRRGCLDCDTWLDPERLA